MMNDKMPIRRLGVVVGVDGDISQVGTYQMSNDSEFLWYGDVLNGPKIGAYLTILQNDIKIIVTVVTEKIIDQQNTIRSEEFDNRYSKNSINRIIQVKTKGVIVGKEFKVTSQYVPMVGNELTLTSVEDLKVIYGINNDSNSIIIGKSLLEGQPIPLSIDRIFASHIGVFGNTGSGKSNTLHKLYLELLRSKFRPKILERSQFFVIDFNGEYTEENSFNVSPSERKIVFNINTRTSKSDKIPVSKEYLFDPDILSILFGATVATQIPFLRKSLRIWNDKKFTGDSISHFVVGSLKKILTSGDSASLDAKDNWISIAKEYIPNYYDENINTYCNILDSVSSLEYNSSTKSYKYADRNYINANSPIEESALEFLHITEIEKELSKKFEELNLIDQLKFHLDFQKVHQSSWKSTNIEYLNGLFNRIDTALDSLKKVVEIHEASDNLFGSFNIINLVHANQEITRLIPMLLSKMIYDRQKMEVAGNDVENTKHLIIDEAHNILNAQNHSIGDSWQDYRLNVFEEIIKEGRKFGFYLTLSSQRPADISPTILSQVHNYFIHRLVNDNDLKMLENTMPTLDRNSFLKIPSLGKGEVIITGNAIQVPVFVKVDKEELIHPSSDDVNLTNLWSDNLNAKINGKN